ncbi:GH3 auxin-responsive promoter family protein [Chloroflexota bacterium]
MVKSEKDRVWSKYCGFLDLPLEQFMRLQEASLTEQLGRLALSGLGSRLMGLKAPVTMHDFRQRVPLTTYEDYLPELDIKDSSALPEIPYAWAHTSGASGAIRRVPWTKAAYQRQLDNLMSVFILACSRDRGNSLLAEGDRVLYNVAPSPYLSGLLANGAAADFNLRSVMDTKEHDDMDFRDKVTKGFEAALRSGVDILVAMTSVLVKTGNEFGKRSRQGNLKRHFGHPAELFRVGRGYLKSRVEQRPLLPKDIWPLKALIGWGMDSAIYSEQVRADWGVYPYEFHACTEAGIIAVQSWTRQGLTLIPYSNFYEFIPVSESLKQKQNLFYEPETVLFDELKPGESYEVVITSLFGMPFIRYRLGHIIRVISPRDESAGIDLPQIVYEGRGDELIDIAGFTRIGEKSVLQCLANLGVNYEDWTIRKEMDGDSCILHLYIEMRNGSSPNLAPAFASELANVDLYYRDLVNMLGMQPTEITELPHGTFRSYYDNKMAAGAELALRRPARINASDDVIIDLLSNSTTCGKVAV